MELQTVLQATEPRLVALEQALGERDRQLAGHRGNRRWPACTRRDGENVEPGAGRHGDALERELATTRAAHTAELERIRSEHGALAARLAARLAAAEGRSPSATELQLRDTELTLEHTLRELEESRLAAVGARRRTGRRRAARHDATGTARGPRADHRGAARRACQPRPHAGSAGDGRAPDTAAADNAGHNDAAAAALETARAQLEEQRITGIELQTILDATERRLAAVSATLADREREITAVRAQLTTLEAAAARSMRAATAQRAEQQVRGSGSATAAPQQHHTPAPTLFWTASAAIDLRPPRS